LGRPCHQHHERRRQLQRQSGIQHQLHHPSASYRDQQFFSGHPGVDPDAPAGEDPYSILGQQRYYNKAQVLFLVSNTTVTATFKTSPTDPSPIVVTALYSASDYRGIVTNFPFLSVSNTFTDQREMSKTIKATQIDVNTSGSGSPAIPG